MSVNRNRLIQRYGPVSLHTLGHVLRGSMKFLHTYIDSFKVVYQIISHNFVMNVLTIQFKGRQ